MIQQIYDTLFTMYGSQGWWPLVSHDGTNPTKSGSVHGYHPGDYSFPRTESERFEICVGAILTQNTAWPNVEKALLNLQQLHALDSQALLDLNEDELKNAIRPAGYFNQKAKKLRIFAEFFSSTQHPTRQELLALWGIGPETADSILLYAYGMPTFVVDAYTRRIFSHLDIIKSDASYDEIKEVFESELKKDTAVFQEYHALIVEHAKRYYAKKQYGECLLYEKIKQMKKNEK